jgi:subtilisin family serine protease
VVVGVLDSGVEVDHPGLVKNIWTNPNEIPNNGKDDDGYVDDIHGWNFLGGKNGDIDVDNMEVTRVVKKYQSVFEGADSAKNKRINPNAGRICDVHEVQGYLQKVRKLNKIYSFIQ